MLDRTVFVENDRIVVFYGSVFLVGHLYLPVCKRVHLVFTKITIIEVGLLVEKCSLDLCAGVVNQFNVK